MKIFSLLLASLLLVSCAPISLDMADKSVKTGDYKISHVNVVSSEKFPAKKIANYEVIKPLLEKSLEDKLLGYGQGRPVDLTVAVMNADFDLNTAQMILVGDFYDLSSYVSIADSKTKSPLGSKNLYTNGAGGAGVIGVATVAGLDQKKAIQDLANRHAALIKFALYHKK